MSAKDELQALKKRIPSFCVLPFIHFATHPDGRTRPCCLYDGHINKEVDSNGEQRPYNLGVESIGEFWNSREMREIRRKMLAGEELEACSACYQEEKRDPAYLSYRRTSLDQWIKEESDNVLSRILEAEASDGRVSDPPFYFDLRYGNLCNLACRSCHPVASRKIITDYQALYQEDQWFREKHIWNPTFNQEAYLWPENENFWREMDSYLPKARKFYFTGGEPTLIAKNYDLMEICIERKLSGQIELMFNTNLVQLPQRFLDCISKFKRVVLNLSIDGFGEVQEYLRSGSSWPAIAENLQRLSDLNLPQIELVLSTVVQAGNALNLDQIFGFVNQLNMKSAHRPFVINPILLVKPDFLDCQILPDDVREIARERLKKFAEESSFRTDERRFVYEKLLQIADRLGEPRVVHADKLLKEFIHFNRILDKRRNTDIRKSLPELSQLLQIS